MASEARILLMKAKIFRILAGIFALAGLLVFIILYMQNVDGAFLSSLTNPFIIVIILIPFLPAAVLSFRASRMEKEYMKKYGSKADNKAE